MKEEERQRAIRIRLCRTAEAPPRQLPPISTGNPVIDRALGCGGLPRSRIVEIFGPDACGKTTLALRAIAALQRGGGAAALIDADHAFDPGRGAALGVSLEKLVLAQPDWGEQALEIARALAASGALDLVVVDSAAALAPKAELESSLEAIVPAWHAAVLGRGLRRLASTAARSGVCILFLNQIRSGKPGDGFETTAGGRALRIYAALRVELRPLSGGTRARLRVVRNKLGPVGGEAEFGVL